MVIDTEICNYADDTTVLAYGSDMCPILKSLDEDASLLSLWFENNYMNMNNDKSHCFVFGSKENEVTLSFPGCLIQESDEEKPLGVIIDKTLSFKNHDNNFCKKASQKLHALARVSKDMEESQLKLNMASFVMSHFSCCPLLLDVS